MVLLYDLMATQPNVDGKFHGGGKYAKKVFLSLIAAKTNNTTILGVYNSAIKLDDDIILQEKSNKVELIDIQEQSLREIIKNYQVTRFYSALPYNIKGLKHLGCEVVGTIHGLRELETLFTFHSLLYFTSLKDKVKIALKVILSRYLAKRKKADLKSVIENIYVITVSNHTKYSIIANFGKLAKKEIEVFYSPDVTNDANTAEASKSLNASSHFLMVSGNRWLKNNIRSAIALDSIFSEHTDIKNNVVITGVADKNIFLKHLNNKNRFIFHDYVDEDLLHSLYNKSFALIYMSLNEGFGYPPLEAMKANLPVVCSPFTSITEICGDAVLYANPISISEIKNRILQLYDSDIYNNLVNKGKSQYIKVNTRQTEDLHKMTNFLLNERLNIKNENNHC